MANNLDPLSHALGGIEKQLELITKTLGEDRMASAAWRTEMRRDVTAVRDAVHELKGKVDSNSAELAEIKPDVEDYRITKAQGVGVWNTAKTLWAIVIAVGAAGFGALLTAFGLRPPPHP